MVEMWKTFWTWATDSPWLATFLALVVLLMTWAIINTFIKNLLKVFHRPDTTIILRFPGTPDEDGKTVSIKLAKPEQKLIAAQTREFLDELATQSVPAPSAWERLTDDDET